MATSIFQQYANAAPIRAAAFIGSSGETFATATTTTELVDDVMQTLDTYAEVEGSATVGQHGLQVQSYATGALDESMIAASLQPDLNAQGEISRVEYFAVPPNGTQLPVQVGASLVF